MNNSHVKGAAAPLVAVAVAAILAACAATPAAPPGSAAVRTKLTALKSQPQLAAQVPAVLQEAEKAVVLAETPQRDVEVAKNRVYLADKLVDTARATAETRLAEAQRTALKQQSDDARLAARTREAEAAQRTASAARAEAEASRIAADNSRNEAERARGAAEANRLVANAAVSAAASAEDQRQELARQIVILQGTTTERGIVLTLGDVLFATGSDQLKPGAAGNLDRLVAFMGMYGDRSATIEGHTDSVGDERSNEMLSQRRADSVKAYLQGKGVATNRLMSTGKGEAYPISGNDSAGGRQQNRRVEVIIDNPVPTVGSVR